MDRRQDLFLKADVRALIGMMYNCIRVKQSVVLPLRHKCLLKRKALANRENGGARKRQEVDRKCEVF